MFDSNGRYSEDKNAAPSDVTVSHMAESIWIRGEAVRLETWPLEDIRCVERINGGAGARLRCVGAPDARLQIDDSEQLAALEQLCPNLYRRDTSGWRLFRGLAIWGAISAGLLILLFQVVIPLFSDRIARAIPPDAEPALGAVVEKQVLALAAGESGAAAAGQCRTPEGVAALNKLVAGLNRGMAAGIDPSVIFVEAPIQDAIAIPGGKVIIFSGLLNLIDHPNAFAGILAHEFGHVAARHPLRLTIERGAASVLLGLLIGDRFGGAALSGAGRSALHTAYTPDLEREADMVAIGLMREAGWSGRAYAGFIATLLRDPSDLQGLATTNLLATHPPSQERVSALRAQTGEGGGSALGDTDWLALKGMCAV